MTDTRPHATPLHVAVAGGLGTLVVAAALLLAGGDGLDGFIRASPEHTRADAAHIHVVEAGDGFDGQFYYRLAIDPFSDAERVDGVALDLPALRAARIGYPGLAGALALGQRAAVPGTLVLVNVLAGAVLAGASAGLARRGGRSAWWGLAVLAFPGFVYTLGFDLAELVEAAAVMAALVAIRAERAGLAAAALVLAVLTKETAMALPLGIVALAVVAAALPRAVPARSLAPGRTATVAAVVALGVAVVWQALLWVRWDEVPVLGSADKNIRTPFGGLIAARDAFAPTSGEGLFRLGSLAVVLVAAAAALTVAWSRRPRSTASSDPDRALYEVAGLLVAVVTGTLMSEFVWAGATSFMRGLTEVWVLSLAVLLTRPAPSMAPLRATVLAGVGGTGATALAEVAKRM